MSKRSPAWGIEHSGSTWRRRLSFRCGIPPSSRRLESFPWGPPFPGYLPGSILSGTTPCSSRPLSLSVCKARNRSLCLPSFFVSLLAQLFFEAISISRSNVADYTLGYCNPGATCRTEAVRPCTLEEIKLATSQRRRMFCLMRWPKGLLP